MEITGKKDFKKLTFQDFYQRELGSLEVGSSGTQAMALCPFHSDSNPSLSINLQTGGWHCFGCREKGSIFKFYMKKYNVDYATAVQMLSEIAGTGIRQVRKGKIVQTYDYVDEEGKVLFQTVRYEPKDFRQRRPDGKGGWTWDLKGIRLVPYKLYELLNAKNKYIYKGKCYEYYQKIFIVEGEKDADTLKALGLITTCSPMGAGKWREEYNKYFIGKDIVVIPDNDKPGRKHAENVARTLYGIAKSVKIVELSNLPEKGDVSDWIEQGGTKEDLLAISRKTHPKSPYNFLVRGSDLINSDIEDDEWIIDKLIPQQSITLLHGKGGVGKTWLSIRLADAVSRGIPFMDLVTKRMPVVYVDFENSLPVLTKRVRMIGASEVYFWHLSNKIKMPPRLDVEGWDEYKNLPENSLIIFDTLRASQSGEENSSKDMASILNKLKELREIGFTIILLHHTPKSNERIYKGSTAILDLADHVLSLTKVKKEKPEQEVDDEDSDCSYRFGTKDKTRYEPYHLFMEFVPDKGFVLAPDPDEEAMKEIHGIITELKESLGTLPIQGKIIEKANEELGLGVSNIIKFLKKGEGKYWNSQKIPEKKNAKVFNPITDFQFSKNIYNEKTEKQRESKDSPSNNTINAFSRRIVRLKPLPPLMKALIKR